MSTKFANIFFRYFSKINFIKNTLEFSYQHMYLNKRLNERTFFFTKIKNLELFCFTFYKLVFICLKIHALFLEIQNKISDVAVVALH